MVCLRHHTSITLHNLQTTLCTKRFQVLYLWKFLLQTKFWPFDGVCNVGKKSYGYVVHKLSEPARFSSGNQLISRSSNLLNLAACLNCIHLSIQHTFILPFCLTVPHLLCVCITTCSLSPSTTPAPTCRLRWGLSRCFLTTLQYLHSKSCEE